MSESDIREAKKVMEFIQTNQDSLAKRISNIESISASPQVLSRITTPVAVSNSIAETTLHSGSLPGNSLRTSNFVELFAVGRCANPSAGAVNFTWRLKYGSSSLVLGPFSISALSTTTGRLFTIYGLLKARDASALKQQFLAEIIIGTDFNVFNANSLFRGYTTSDIAEDSTVDQPVTLTVQHGTAALTIITTLVLFKLGAPQVAA